MWERIRNLLGLNQRAVPLIQIISMGLMLQGCGVAPIRNVNLSFNTVRGIVVRNLPGGLKSESANGRELRSAFYQALRADKFVLLDDLKAESVPQRNFMRVTILGDRRPYSIEVAVYSQKQRKGTRHFSNASLDDDLTTDMVQRIQDSLANRREDGNVIDEFRAF